MTLMFARNRSFRLFAGHLSSTECAHKRALGTYTSITARLWRRKRTHGRRLFSPRRVHVFALVTRGRAFVSGLVAFGVAAGRNGGICRRAAELATRSASSSGCISPALAFRPSPSLALPLPSISRSPSFRLLAQRAHSISASERTLLNTSYSQATLLIRRVVRCDLTTLFVSCVCVRAACAHRHQVLSATQPVWPAPGEQCSRSKGLRSSSSAVCVSMLRPQRATVI